MCHVIYSMFQISWIADFTDRAQYQLATVGGDGKLLFWSWPGENTNNNGATLINYPSRGYIMMWYFEEHGVVF